MKASQYLIFMLLCCWLTSCGSTINPPEAEALLNKSIALNTPRYLTQTKYITWMNTTTDMLVIERPANALPTIKEYQNNPAEWQRWHERHGAQYRIIGLLPAGTPFHFYQIVIPENPSTDLFEFHTMIDSGLYKNVSAYYRYNTDYPEDERFVHQLKNN